MPYLRTAKRLVSFCISSYNTKSMLFCYSAQKLGQILADGHNVNCQRTFDEPQETDIPEILAQSRLSSR